MKLHQSDELQIVRPLQRNHIKSHVTSMESVLPVHMSTSIAVGSSIGDLALPY